MIFLSVKFEKEDSSDFEKVKDFFLQKSQPGMESQWTIENIKFAPTCIISSREVPRLGDSPLRGGRADIMMKLLVIKCLHWVSLLTSDGSHGAREFSLIIYKITFCPLTSLSSVVCQRKFSSDLKWECFDCQQFRKYIEREK